ncbi:hypothetical protein SGLAM104S_08324 [Streptomyces glaucescens]
MTVHPKTGSAPGPFWGSGPGGHLGVAPVRVKVPSPSVFRYSTVKDFPSGVKVTPVRPTAFSPAVRKLNVSPS